MDAYETIITKLDVKELSSEKVPGEIKKKILEAARATGSSMNTQHWRFIFLQRPDEVSKLAADSSTGGWVAGANFAVIILTSPKIPGHTIDAGRALQDMEVAAWSFGVASRLFTGVKQEQLRKDFGIPAEMEVSAVLGFGYPKHKIVGRKNRKPFEEVVFAGKYGNRVSPADFV